MSRRHKNHRSRVWTQEDMALVRNLKLKAYEVALMIGRSDNAVRGMRLRLGLRVRLGPMKRHWTPQELALIGDYRLQSKAVAKVTGLTVDQVSNKRRQLGIKVWELRKAG